MKTFEIGHLRLVTGLDQGFKTVLYQGGESTTKHGLFAKKIGLGLFLKRGLQDSGSSCSNPLCPRQRKFFSLLRWVLVNRDQSRYTFTFEVLTPDNMPGTFRRDHDHIDVLRRNDGLEVNGKTVTEKQRLTVSEIRFNLLFVNRRSFQVRRRKENDN